MAGATQMFNPVVKTICTHPLLRYCLPVIYMAVFSCNVLAQSDSSFPAFLTFNVNEIPATGQNSLYHLFQDSKGRVWGSSFEGVLWFYGKTWHKPSEERDGRVLGSNVNSSFWEDDKGNVWFSTESGVNCYNAAQKRFVIKHALSAFTQKSPLLICIEQKQYAWLNYEGDALYRVNLSNGTQQRFAPLIGHLFAVDTAADGRLKHIYYTVGGLAQAKGLKRFEVEAPEIHSEFAGQESVNAMQVRNSQSLLLVTDSGLLDLNPISGKLSPFAPNIQWQIQSVAVDSRKNIWAYFNEKGLYLYEQAKNAWRSVAIEGTQKTFDQDQISRLHIDREDNLWMVYEGKGVAFANFHKQEFQNIQLEKNTLVSSIAEGPDGGLIVVDDRKYPYLFDENGRLLRALPLTSSGVIFQVYKSRRESCWLCTSAGLFRLEGEGWRLAGTPPETIFWLFENGKGDLMGVGSGNLYQLMAAGKNEIEPVLQQENLSDQFIVFAGSDGAGNVFYNKSDAQVGVITGDSKLQEIALSGFWGVAPDRVKPDVRWLAHTKGLSAYDLRNNKIIKAIDAERLPNDFCHGLLNDGNGVLWASTNDGVFAYNTQTDSLAVYDVFDGLAENAFVEKGWLKHSNGRLYFANKNKLNWINPLSGSARIKPFSLYRLEVMVDTQLYTSNHIDLRYSKYNLQFRFAAPDYANPAAVKFRYRLVGYDRVGDWRQGAEGSEITILYPSIPYGKYQLEVFAINSDGVWSAQHVISIHIGKPFWLTWWFISLAILFLVSISVLITRQYFRRLQEKQARELRLRSSELTSLRAQLNPHFIANALTPINRYAKYKGVEQMRRYVNQFADLMRDILESARNPLIPVQKELETLRNYIEFESAQFEYPIEYEIVTDASLPLQHIEMPGMLIQPFVENAIKHSLVPNQGRGKITIELRQIARALEFSIHNEGGAYQPKAPGTAAHKSRGLEITRQRLQLYDQQYAVRGKSDFEISNLENGGGVQALLTLQLPLHYFRGKDNQIYIQDESSNR